MTLLLNGDCLELMKDLDDDSVDLIFCDLPYGQTSCKWDCPIDLDLFWIQVMRIKKLNTPIFMTTTTKFGVSLINSAPKKCHFRYDIVWVKSAAAGFLSAKKMPMRKHEMIYVFYEKLPFYDLSSHTHKFIKEETGGATGGETYCKEGDKEYETCYGGVNIPKHPSKGSRWEPPLPVSVVKEGCGMNKGGLYSGSSIEDNGIKTTTYDPPLPNSIVKEIDNNNKEEPKYEGEELCKYDVNKNTYGGGAEGRIKIPKDKKYHEVKYDPPLPNSMLEIKSTRGKHSTEKPVALMEWVLKYYSKEGDVVLDPTMGSGSTGVACKNMNRNFIGFEMDAEIYDGAVNRLT
tara:strand:- start:76 stop:1110 length:1035 start_codon:yes stop_codon:yes gene_type:complete